MRGGKGNRRGLSACFAALLLGLALPPGAVARPGDLDPGFGLGGRVGTATAEFAPDWYGTGPGPALRPTSYGDDVHLAAAPDGSIVVARGNLLLRFAPDGRLDESFGEAGTVVISEVDDLRFGLQDVEIDREGRVLVFGTAVDPSTNRFIHTYTISEVLPSYATVLRLNANGELDPGFGGGDGVFRDSLGLSSTPPAPADIPLVEVDSAELDSQGRMVMAVGKVGLVQGFRSYPGWVVDALARLTPSGELDPSFGGDGVVEGILRGHPKTGIFFKDFCVSALDKPVVASSEFTFFEDASEVRPARGWLSRFQTDGAADRTFGRNGVAHARKGSGPLACKRSGQTYTLQAPVSPRTGDRRMPWRVVLRSPDGNVNRGFARRAIVKLGGRRSNLSSLTVDPRGRVLLAGTVRLPRPGGKGRRSFFTVIRLLPSGRLDRSFGRGGWLRTGFGPKARVVAREAAIDASGRLVVAGDGRAPWLQPGGIVLARYLLEN